MRCPICQTDNPTGAPFCAECGSRLSSTASSNPISPTGALPQQTVLQDRYVITQKLGQGGMGAVYHASDRRLSTVSWAIKEMSESAITGPLELQQARDAFRREAEMLAALSHPNLPRVTDHFEQDGKAYLVMEFVPGETLLSFVQRTGLPQPLSRVQEWARQLVDVLEYLHSQTPPIIFRDLKPANIMLTPQGQLKLIDFGIARLFKPGQAKDTQAFGTIGYSAPEQYGRGQTDARADVYSLGVLLHQLLTGYDPTTTPFRLPPAHQLNPQIPAHISAALASATDGDPARRFVGVRAFYAALAGTGNQVLVQPGAQPIGQPLGGAIYQRPAQPYGQPGSQPYSQPGSQPYGQPVTGQPYTTGLASGARWTGICSLVVMGLSTLLVLLDVAAGRTEANLVGGLGALIGLPVIFGSGPTGLVLGIVALMRPITNMTVAGRRHAIIAIVTSSMTFLLCCVILMLIDADAG